MKAPDSFGGTKAHKLRGFIQYFQLVFHNDPANPFSDRKKVLYSTSFLTGRAGKWIEPFLSKISNEYPSYLLNNWKLFETQLFTLFGDPNEVRKAGKELDNMRMKERGHVFLYISDFGSLISKIGDWGEGAYIHVYRRNLHQDFCTSWLPILVTLILFKNLWTLPWNWIPDTMRDRRRRVFIKKRSLWLLDPILQGLLKTHLQKGLTIRRTRRASSFKLQRTIPILLFSIRTINQLVLKRRGGSKNGYVLIVVESTQLKNASRDLRTSLGHQEASLASREKP
ncbi:hypothetical protein O181_085315 [Austropuccinia psidii MF-1]|uniref:Retrotransposon gag domain-containing protein n=1 Tax=Austropuccinia psidii MF-1 TaxID=1389203 RepID=A0A9Q3FXB0_9BASI|nr:hypothetical protein [Austropuccinia psidii MF-1]